MEFHPRLQSSTRKKDRFGTYILLEGKRLGKSNVSSKEIDKHVMITCSFNSEKSQWFSWFCLLWQ